MNNFYQEFRQKQQYLKLKYFLLMDFHKYINHQAINEMPSQITLNKINHQKPRVIKFVGNMEQNIKQLLSDIDCHCASKRQFYNILMVFANKIQKLRNERQHYKTTLKEYLINLNQKAQNQNVIAKIQKCLQPKSIMQPKSIIKHQQSIEEATSKQNIKMVRSVSNKHNIISGNNIISASNIKNIPFASNIKSLQSVSNIKDIPSITNVKDQNSKYLYDRCQKQDNQMRNNFTAIKKSVKNNISPIKQRHTNTEDKRMRHFYQDQQIDNVQLEISLNLSSFEQSPLQNDQIPNSLMSQTNLLQSDSEEQKKSQIKCQQKMFELQQKINKLKILKESTTLNMQKSIQKQKDRLDNQFSARKQQKKNQNPQQSHLGIQVKKVKSSKRCQQNKQNNKVQSCLKQYNISLQKLQEFIENKQCLKQLQSQKSQEYGLWQNFKTIDSTTLEKNNMITKKGVRVSNPLMALNEKKINFNLDI